MFCVTHKNKKYNIITETNKVIINISLIIILFHFVCLKCVLNQLSSVRNSLIITKKKIIIILHCNGVNCKVQCMSEHLYYL